MVSATASGEASIAVGAETEATEEDAIALGKKAAASAKGSIAIGAETKASAMMLWPWSLLLQVERPPLPLVQKQKQLKKMRLP